MVELYFSYLQRGTTEILKYLRSRIQTGRKIILCMLKSKEFQHFVIACVVAYTSCHEAFVWNLSKLMQ